jgi:hypothetical protein
MALTIRDASHRVAPARIKICLLMRGAQFGGGGRPQPRYLRAQRRHLIAGGRAAGLDGRQQDLLDRTCHRAGPDKPQGRADAAEMVRVSVRPRQIIQIVFIFDMPDGGLDTVNAGIELIGEALAQRLHPIAVEVCHHTFSNVPREARIKRDTPNVKGPLHELTSPPGNNGRTRNSGAPSHRMSHGFAYLYGSE